MGVREGRPRTESAGGEGQLVFNGIFLALNAAVAGLGLAYVPEDLAQHYLAKGRLKRVLDECDQAPAHRLHARSIEAIPSA